MSIEKLPHHYSMTSPASVYDEEAMTALQLAARTAGKVNECVDVANRMDERMGQIPAEVDEIAHKTFKEMLDKNAFDAEINAYAHDLEKRVENLLNNVPEGGTSMDAEVVDARKGAGGNVHATTGDHIRFVMHAGQGMNADAFTLPSSYFELGSLNSDGTTPNVQYHVRSNLLVFPFTVYMTAADGYHFRGYFYDGEGVATRNLQWYERWVKVPANTPFRVVVTTIDSQDGDVMSVYECANALKFCSDVAEANNVQNFVNAAQNGGAKIPERRFSHGVIWEQGTFYPSHNYRVTTMCPVKYPVDLYLVAKDGYRFGLMYYNNETTFGKDKLWQTHYFVPANQWFALTVGKMEEDTSVQANIVEFADAVTAYAVDSRESVIRDLQASMRFAIGSLYEGELSAYASRIALVAPIYTKYPLTIKFAPGYRTAVATYDENGVMLKDHGWVTASADYTIPGNTYFSITVTTDTYDKETPHPENIAYETAMFKALAFECLGVSFKPIEHEVARRTGTPDPSKIIGVNHRGFNPGAPENTLVAFRESRVCGFDYVETDIRWSADGVCYLLHDATINRTARRLSDLDTDLTGEDPLYIANMTSEELAQYSFGHYFSEEFTTEKIPTFEEFIGLCKRVSLHPFIEIETIPTADQAKILWGIVKKYRMENNVTWVSFEPASVMAIWRENHDARVGINTNAKDGLTSKVVGWLKLFKSLGADVFISNMEEGIENVSAQCQTYDVPLMVWCPNDEDTIVSYVKNLPNCMAIVSDQHRVEDVVHMCMDEM